MTSARANPFADSDELPAFAPKPRAPKPVVLEQIDRIAEANNFPSRQPASPATGVRPGRRYRTGRTQQINIKATPQVIERLYRLADAKHVPLGELLEEAVGALEKGAGQAPS